MILEICASNIQSAINAKYAGANRIELCSELAVGGITPSYGFLKCVMETIKISVFALIRPRSGNFTYSEKEYNIMKRDISFCKEIGVAGIVSGVLNHDNTIDIERTKELVELSSPLPFTFHRAFDWTPDPFQALEQLIDIGANRILTSGQETKATAGFKLLKELHKRANNRIIILPGCGINSENVIQFKKADFKEVHASASIKVDSANTFKMSMNSSEFISDSNNIYSDVNKIKSILKNISNED